MKKETKQKDRVTLEDIAILVKQNSKDIGALSSVVKQNSKDVEDLATMTAREFSNIKSEFKNEIRELKDEVSQEFSKINQKLNGMSNRIDDAVPGKVSMQQHEALAMRVGKIENKMAIK